ncbi:RNA pseudouridylate synthase domain-containing protein 2-like [Actinia tenebrosa]|uniref:Pseudouridine synthase n=1 Tax=Actinia tenebrosa TaxID=6105 RepID=A0A6P8I3B6_ACTTE|nr:RNA pseudouridylate synthase domain-containing protein 2-like [Actinia tenebrosa]
MAGEEKRSCEQEELENTVNKKQLQDEEDEELKADKGKKRKLSKEDKKNAKEKKVKVTARKKPGFDVELYNETSYFVRNGLRYVTPYHFTFTTHCKGRWVGRQLFEVFKDEFRSEPPEYYEKAIKTGKITVNGETATLDTILKDNEIVCNKVHRHEPPVTAEPLEIIESNEDVVVINKPSSIPVHPCGRYRHNTVVFLLGKEYGLTNLYTVHRIDRLTSGILIFAKTLKKAQELEEQVRERRIRKEYVCRVQGDFPSEPIDCEQPILVVSHKIGVCRVSPNGKTCRTVFTKLHGNGKSSVVQCIPYTGRMHQIRVHLQWLGYPIIDDPIYNSPVWGTNRGKGGVTDDQALKVIQALAESTTIMDTDITENRNKSENLMENMAHSSVEDHSEDEKSVGRMEKSLYVKDGDCSECRIQRRDPTPEELTMCLHAISYKGPDWEYQTKQPPWVAQDCKHYD